MDDTITLVRVSINRYKRINTNVKIVHSDSINWQALTSLFRFHSIVFAGPMAPHWTVTQLHCEAKWLPIVP